MKVTKLFTLPFLMCLMAFSCQGQNGPTPPSIQVNFAQAVPTTTSGPVIANCVYIGVGTGVYAMPGKCSTSPVTTFTITNNLTRGTKYFLTVTAQYSAGSGVTESAFSSEVTATPPQMNSPTGLATGIIALLDPHVFDPDPVTTASMDGKVKAIAR